MQKDNRKVVIIGTGMVGMSYAYAMLNQNACDELVLIDINKERAVGEAMDLNHGLAFSNSHMKIYAGEYRDCENADIVVICAGVAQKPGESRLDLLQRNAAVFKSIVDPVTESGFNGIFLVATNPVDIMARITQQLSGRLQSQTGAGQRHGAGHGAAPVSSGSVLSGGSAQHARLCDRRARGQRVCALVPGHVCHDPRGGTVRKEQDLRLYRP